jgi:hypothetical protein
VLSCLVYVFKLRDGSLKNEASDICNKRDAILLPGYCRRGPVASSILWTSLAARRALTLGLGSASPLNQRDLRLSHHRSRFLHQRPALRTTSYNPFSQLILGFAAVF